MPWRLRKKLLASLGFELAPGAKVGFSLFFCSQVRLEQNARIGHMTIVKGLDLLHLKESSVLGNLNWISGFPLADTSSFSHIRRQPALIIGRHAAITHRHYVDCAASITIGEFTTVAGVRSQFFTHSINLKNCKQECAEIVIGRYCQVGTGCIVLPGAELADYSVLSAGSVLKGQFQRPYRLLSGNPAVEVKELPPDLEYFSRAEGRIA